jgi:hypothetical protein
VRLDHSPRRCCLFTWHLRIDLRVIESYCLFGMSTGTPNLPVTPIRSAAMTSQNGATDIYSKLKESSSQIDLKESQRLSEALAIREAPEKVDISAMQPPPNIKDPPASQVIVDQDEHDAESNVVIHERAASTQELEPFDWDDFQARYDQAMAEAKAREETLLHEFNELANASSLSISYILSY